MHKLTISRLKKIIAEEVSLLKEGEKEDQAAAMAQNASKLLKAIELFKASASSKALSSADAANTTLEKHLLETEKMLKRIVASPMTHVDGPKQPDEVPSSPVASQSLSAKKVSIKPNI